MDRIEISFSRSILAMGVFTALVLVGAAGATPLLSNSGGGSWQYYKDISIKENSGSALTDYQVLIELNRADFPDEAQNNGADIRFTDSSGYELNYWIENWNYAGKSAKIWVKIPNISAGLTTVIRMYYGNPGADVISNGNKVFDFFDDFEYSDSVTNHGWGNADTRCALQTTSADWATSGTRSMKIVHTKDVVCGIIRQISIPTPFLITYDAKQTQSSTASIFVGSATASDWFTGTTREFTFPYAFAVFTIYDYTNPVTYTGSYNYPYIVMGQSTSYSSATAYIDNFRIRKYTSIEPTLSIGARQTIQSLTGTISISSPQNGEHINWSPDGYMVKGTFYGTPGLNLYVFVHPTTTDRYWIQRTPTITENNWETLVYLGTKDVGANENYEIYAIVTNKTLNAGMEFGTLPDNMGMVRVSVFRPASPAITSTLALKESETNWMLYGSALFSVFLIGVILLRKVKKPNQKTIHIASAFGYKGATIIYKVKLENNTSEPISDIKVYPYVPDVFLLREKEKSIALIEPNSSQTVTFEIRPTGECGDCNVSGRVNYYDMASKKRHDIELETKSLSIVCPLLHGKDISETDWHKVVSNLVKTEESTKEIDIPAESLFTMISRIIKDMNMYMLKPEVTQNQKFFNGIARFYGEGIKGLRYAAQVEVVGGTKKAELILKAWAEKEDALTGFYHGLLDEIEKRIKIKGYIDEPIIQHFNIAGHYIAGQLGKIIDVGDKKIQIGTQVNDSNVQSSNARSDPRKCPKCGREVEVNEKFCLECGAKL